jgi:hypothetical protein
MAKTDAAVQTLSEINPDVVLEVRTMSTGDSHLCDLPFLQQIDSFIRFVTVQVFVEW